MATRLALPGALIGIAVGLLAADAGHAPAAIGAAAAAGILLPTLVVARRPAAAIACAALATGLLLGVWRGAALALPSGPGTVAGLIGRGEVELVGTVVDDPRPRGSTQQVVLEDLTARLAGRSGAIRGRLLATLPRATLLTVGRRVVLKAEVEAPAAFDGFDYPAFLARQGIGGLARTRAARVLDGPARAGPAEIAAAARTWLLGGLNEMVPEPEASLGAGILLGVRSSIAPEISDAFAVAGLTHVVAISGWNIAIVAAIVGALLRPLEERRGGHWLAPSAAGVTIAAYVVLTGASPSVVRAALMAGAMMVARFGGSRAHAASALGLAAPRHADRRPIRAVGCRLSAVGHGDCRPHRLRGVHRGSPCELAGLAEGAGCADPGRAAHHPAGSGRQLRSALVGGAPGEHRGRSPGAAGHAAVRDRCTPWRDHGGTPYRSYHRPPALGHWRRRLAAAASHDPRRRSGRLDPLRRHPGHRAGLAGIGVVPGARPRLAAFGGPREPRADGNGRGAAAAYGPRAIGRALDRHPCCSSRALDAGAAGRGTDGGRPPARRPDIGEPPGRSSAPGRPGHRSGRCDPGDIAVRRAHARRRRAGSGSPPAAPGGADALVAAPDRCDDPDPPARGSRCWPRGGARALRRRPDPGWRPHLREPDLSPLSAARAGRTKRAARARSGGRTDSAGPHHDRDAPLPHRRGCRRAPARRRHQQRVRGRPPAQRRLHCAADRGRGDAGRGASCQTRTPGPDRRPEGRPPRLAFQQRPGTPRRHATRSGPDLGRDGQRLRASPPGDARPPARDSGAAAAPDRSGGEPRGDQRRAALPGDQPRRQRPVARGGRPGHNGRPTDG